MTEIADILLYPDPRFSRTAAAQPVDDALRAIGASLLATARQHRAYGLAAVHIGQVAPVVVVTCGPPEQRDYRLLYNPVILSASEAREPGLEGSVSLPGLEVEIVRPTSVELSYDDAEGVRCDMSLSGFPARVAQHEIEQMNGIFFLEKLSRLKRDAALRRFRKLSR
ncbi:MAG: hypothetical protein ABS76_36890 [Pelagibacterium sp. SCN 64-44]|nr:MAG: hypothetical protein ABS76_36890 [Pelagibacterium sp. SCN 64-44]